MMKFYKCVVETTIIADKNNEFFTLDLPFKLYGAVIICEGYYVQDCLNESLVGKKCVALITINADDTNAAQKLGGFMGDTPEVAITDERYSIHYPYLVKDNMPADYAKPDKDNPYQFAQWSNV